MSNLLVQNIKHTNGTTAQTIDTSGRTTVSVMNNDSTYRSDGGAVTQNLVQGLAKAWGQFQGTSTVAVTDSLNYASITDNGTGVYAFNFTNNMGSTYSALGSTGESHTQGFVRVGGIGTTKVDVNTRVSSSGSLYDDDKVYNSVHGDLA